MGAERLRRAKICAKMKKTVKERKMEEKILEKLKEIIASIMKTDVSGVSRESRLKEDLRADSLDKINMLMALEEAYDIEMDEEEALTFKTVGDVVDYLVKELS